MMKWNYEEAAHKLKMHITVICPGISNRINWTQTLLINSYILIEFAMNVSNDLVEELMTKTVPPT